MTITGYFFEVSCVVYSLSFVVVGGLRGRSSKGPEFGL